MGAQLLLHPRAAIFNGAHIIRLGHLACQKRFPSPDSFGSNMPSYRSLSRYVFKRCVFWHKWPRTVGFERKSSSVKHLTSFTIRPNLHKQFIAELAVVFVHTSGPSHVPE